MTVYAPCRSAQINILQVSEQVNEVSMDGNITDHLDSPESLK